MYICSKCDVDNIANYLLDNMTNEDIMSLSNKSDDLVKARRIIERIKQLTNDLELISVNRREK